MNKFIRSNILVLLVVIIVGLVVYVYLNHSGSNWGNRDSLQDSRSYQTPSNTQIPNDEDVNLGDSAKTFDKTADINYGFADLVDFVDPSVVSIIALKTTQNNSFNGIPLDSLDPLSREFLKRMIPPQGNTPQRLTSLGSGFIVRSDGYIVTNFHVIRGAEEINVLLHDNRQLSAIIYATDEVTDLAVLKVEGEELQSLKFADSSETRVGDVVLAIGNPFGLGGSVSSGIVSAIGRDINMGLYNDFIQTDASINRGNSGGPLLNLKGEVIGINTAIFSPSSDGGNVGIGFAVPSNTIKQVVAQLIANKKVIRSWLGVQIQAVDDTIAKNFNLEKPMGALISNIVPDSPASRSDLKVGDIIVAVNGQEFNNNRDLPKLISSFVPNTAVNLTIISGGVQKDIKVVLEAVPDTFASADGAQDGTNSNQDIHIDEDNYEDLGIQVTQLNSDVRHFFNIEDEIDGVIVTSVKQGSIAQQKGLVGGLIIVSVNQQEVHTLGDLRKILDNNGNDGLVFLVRDLQNRSIFISISATELERGLPDQ